MTLYYKSNLKQSSWKYSKPTSITTGQNFTGLRFQIPNLWQSIELLHSPNTQICIHQTDTIFYYSNAMSISLSCNSVLSVLSDWSRASIVDVSLAWPSNISRWTNGFNSGTSGCTFLACDRNLLKHWLLLNSFI